MSTRAVYSFVDEDEMIQRSMVFHERIKQFENEYDQQAFEKSHDAMQALLEATSSGSRKAVIEGMWTAFGAEHRTNQQSGIRALVAMLCTFGNCDESRACDARNYEAYKFAEQIAKQEGLFFPYI